MSGKKEKKVSLSLTSDVSTHDFHYHHKKAKCDGVWGVLYSQHVPYPIDGLDTVLLPVLPFVACPKCEAAYMLPGFLELIEMTIASHLVVSDKVLTAKEIRFLRLAFSLTQQEVIDAIDMESKSYYSKCETGKEPLGSDKQVRLKLLYATRLGINHAEDYHRLSLTSSRRETVTENHVLNLKDILSKEKIETLASQLKAEHQLIDLPLIKKVANRQITG